MNQFPKIKYIIRVPLKIPEIQSKKLRGFLFFFFNEQSQIQIHTHIYM